MSEDFDIFHNLNELKNANLLAKLKLASKLNDADLKDSGAIDESDDFDMDPILTKSVKEIRRTPDNILKKRPKQTNSGKKKKASKKSTEVMSAIETSLSPQLSFLSTLATSLVEEEHVAKRTRASLGKAKQSSLLVENGNSRARKTAARSRKSKESENVSVDETDQLKAAAVLTKGKGQLRKKGSEHIVTTNSLEPMAHIPVETFALPLSALEALITTGRRGRGRGARSKDTATASPKLGEQSSGVPLLTSTGRRNSGRAARPKKTATASPERIEQNSAVPLLAAVGRRGTACGGRRSKQIASASIGQVQNAAGMLASALSPLQQLTVPARQDAVAARDLHVDAYIDLAASPRIEACINLDSDDELNIAPKNDKESRPLILDQDYDEDNHEINVKIKWKGKPEVFKLRKYQKFLDIYQKLAARENINIRNIVLNIDTYFITPEDTPDSIDYKIYQFINGRVLESRLKTLAKDSQQKQRKANDIPLKIQSDKWKKPLEINIPKTGKFLILYIKCEEELSLRRDQLKLSFDGDLLEYDSTPADLDLEGGEVIDLVIKN
uniref:Ubiquitin-like domain-containing protein n=1 Tax=Glossina pallidipes TaxID=7398 RepID=A0A1A9ZW39_GLOPL